ncbi:hypothetical protein J2X85_004197 [Microbacterium trichothecenolyticum]|nr:hypothetical protein [Microbacterium trichothecenolyticum]MDR7187127.1 hypothetical protein [Microbacterium trichothecenolyticum]
MDDDDTSTTSLVSEKLLAAAPGARRVALGSPLSVEKEGTP